jgi:hypothetical protein
MNNSVYPHQHQRLRRRWVLPLLLLAGLAFNAMSVSAQVSRALPPNASPFGRNYAEWSAAYWQWLFALPVDGHPGTDSPDFDVTDGQSGHVWFLTGPFGTVERSVTIPAGTSLFIALINVDSSSLEEPPFYGATAADQLAIANEFADFITDLSFTVDGKAVDNIEDFRVTSPQFTFTAPTPWIFGATGGTGTAVGVGYFVMLSPLSLGTHTIHYTAAFKFSDAPEDYIGVDMTYHVTVK